MSKKLDPRGEVFGSWSVVEEVGRGEVGGVLRRMWLCRCECGREKRVCTGNLRKLSKHCLCRRKIAVGQRFGKWEVLAPAGPRWLCRCDCGREKQVWAGKLRCGQSTSCGKCRGEDLTGRRFSRLEVLGVAPPGRKRVLCRCDCGKEHVVLRWNLLNGKTESCGCLKVERGRARARERVFVGQKRGGVEVVGEEGRWLRLRCLKCGAEGDTKRTSLYSGVTRKGIARCGCYKVSHGHARRSATSPPYGSWSSMLKRVRAAQNGTSAKHAKTYKGIQVCARWDPEKGGSFQNFLDDLGWPPAPNYSLDRENPWGHYSCGKCSWCQERGLEKNCRWASKSEQTLNRRPHFVNRKVGAYFWRPKLSSALTLESSQA